MLEYGFQPQVDFNSYKKVQVQLEGNSDFRAISQKRLTAQGNTTTYNDYAITLELLLKKE